MNNKHFIFFGDSICVGQWIDISETWVYRLSAAFTKNVPINEGKWAFHNRSINGNTSRQALERMHFDCLSHNPKGMMIQFGLNDCQIWEQAMGYPRVSEKSFKANLAEMIERCLYHKVEYIFLNSNHPTTRTKVQLPYSSNTYEDRNVIYNEIVRDVAKEYLQKRVRFFDINNLFIENIPKTELYQYLLEDEIHLSKKGHDFYFDHFYKFLKGEIVC